MIDRKRLLTDLQKQVKLLETDLRQQVETHLPDVRARLDAEYKRAFDLKRTAATWASWRDERVTQTAVAWVLGTVFVRFSEDNGLLVEPFITGPSRERMTLAEERQAEFLAADAARTHRDWLVAAFDEIGSGQAGKLLFDPRHNALYQIPISHDAARGLIDFWRRRIEGETLEHDFTDAEWDTRFLGDLYQDLSEAARKQFALLQTPEFVEEFILDRTLTPAIRDFGYDVVKMIDPTCGSGHFVLGAFQRLVDLWQEKAPGIDRWEQVRNALDAVHGVDINPFAVAVARFRLLVAAMKAAGFTTLEDAGKYSWPLHLAAGDSLIKPRQMGELVFEDEEGHDPLAEFKYVTEDLEEYPEILDEGHYHVVVGNPPYITVKDNRLKELYKELYQSCYMQYSLSVPFAERFFQLAKPLGVDGRPGYVGQITANSFMKREFGKKLIEEYFAHKVELTEVIDSSGAYIPGHGTPTVILVGQRRTPRTDKPIRAVLGIRGEPREPEDPAYGLVWQAIVAQIDLPGSETEWVSVEDTERSRFSKQPWSLSGGGTSAVMAAIEESSQEKLSSIIKLIGRYTHTGSDESYFARIGTWRRFGISDERTVSIVEGDVLRDWDNSPVTEALFPYSTSLVAALDEVLNSLLWPRRAVLRSRREPGGTHEEIGLTWFEWSRWHPERFQIPLAIGMSFVATHNHFVLDRGGKVFNRTAPAIKLPDGATEDEHLRLLGLLNSSMGCFWLKQVSFNKGEGGGARVEAGYAAMGSEAWKNHYEFTGTKLQEFPLPASYPTKFATELDVLAQHLTAVSPAALVTESTPARASLEAGHADWLRTRARMIALQEELDWQVYDLYGLLEDLRAPADSVPDLNLGERAFEIVLARQIAAGEATSEWFTRHNSTPITEIPSHWPDAYKQIVQRRIDTIESNRNIALIERPECKRRWATDGWDKLQDTALRSWLLDRLEARDLWFEADEYGTEQPRLRTIADLADALASDEDFVSVADIYAPNSTLVKLLPKLIADEHVPYLSALRYKPAGLRKRRDWETTWDEQRAEDAAPDEQAKRAIRDRIAVPPKYGSGDFLKASYWKNRGKLDVPKERFISFPGASLDTDPTLLLGWAGWDHREQALALVGLIQDRDENRGWGADKLQPLVAGMLELQPWLSQWHNEVDPATGTSIAQDLDAFRVDYQNRLELTDDDLLPWRRSA